MNTRSIRSISHRLFARGLANAIPIRFETRFVGLRTRADAFDPIPQWLRVAIFVVIALGIFFRFYHLDRKVLWEDEIYGTVHMLGYTESEIVQASRGFTNAAGLQKYFRPPNPGQAPPNSAADTIGSLAHEDPQHPPLYYVIGHFWTDRFGSSVAAMRGLSALFGILALPCMYFLCAELFASRRAAWLGVALVAISPFHVLYAQEVREYSLWTVATLLMSLCFLRAMRLTSTRAWALYAMTLATSLYIYPLSGLVAIGQGAFLVVTRRTRSPEKLPGYLTACVAAFTLFVPWLLIMIRSESLHRGMTNILATHVATLRVLRCLIDNVRGAFFDFGLIGTGLLRPGASIVLTVFVLALIGYALIRIPRYQNREASMFALVALCLPTMPLVLHDLVLGGELVNQSRYFTPLYLGVELLVVDMFRREISEDSPANRARGALRIALILLLVGGVLSCAVSSQAETWSNKDFEQNRAIAEIVNRSNRPLVVSDFHTSRMLGLGYYLDPSVQLRLNLRCDQCTLPDAPRAKLLDDRTSFGEMFLLGASPELQGEARRWAAGADRGLDIQTIDIKIFPDRRTEKNPLTMFAPV